MRPVRFPSWGSGLVPSAGMRRAGPARVALCRLLCLALTLVLTLALTRAANPGARKRAARPRPWAS